MTLANLWGILGWFLTGIVSLSVPCLYADVPQSWSSSFPTNKNLTAAIYGQGQYFALGWGSMIIRSADGFNWSPALQLGGPPGGGSSDHFFAAAYGNGMFVAGGTGNDLRCTSLDGTHWQLKATTPGSEIIRDAIYQDGYARTIPL